MTYRESYEAQVSDVLSRVADLLITEDIVLLRRLQVALSPAAPRLSEPGSYRTVESDRWRRSWSPTLRISPGEEGTNVGDQLEANP